jgi:hypothetical protein
MVGITSNSLLSLVLALSTRVRSIPVPGQLAQTHHQTEIRKRAGIAYLLGSLNKPRAIETPAISLVFCFFQRQIASHNAKNTLSLTAYRKYIYSVNPQRAK